jgi:hypothetical protein
MFKRLLVIILSLYRAWARIISPGTADLSITQVWKGDDLVSQDVNGVIMEKQNLESIFFAGEKYYKMLMTIASMQLVDAGKLRLDDDITNQLPHQSLAALGIKKGWCSYVQDDRSGPCHRVTPRQLLSSSAGLIDARKCDYAAGAWQRKYCANDVILERQIDVESFSSAILQRPLSEAPGDFREADENFLLLGYLLEQITGQPLNEYLQKSVLVPLELYQTKLISSTEAQAASRESRCGHKENERLNAFGTAYYTIGDMAKLYASVFVAKNISRVSSSSLQSITIGGVSASCSNAFREYEGSCASGFAVDVVMSAEGTPLLIGNIESSSCSASSIVVKNVPFPGNQHVIIVKASSGIFREDIAVLRRLLSNVNVPNVTTSGEEIENYLGPGQAISWVMIPVLFITAIALVVLEIVQKNRMESQTLPSVSKLTLKTAGSRPVLNPLSDNIGNDDL